MFFKNTGIQCWLDIVDFERLGGNYVSKKSMQIFD